MGWFTTTRRVPSGVVDDADLTRLQKLPGFDNQKLIASMASVDNATFPVWRKPVG